MIEYQPDKLNVEANALRRKEKLLALERDEESLLKLIEEKAQVLSDLRQRIKEYLVHDVMTLNIMK